MRVMILGLVIFFGVHSVRIFAEGWRERQIARLGAYGWKGLYSIASIIGFVLIVWGYGLSREQGVAVWDPPTWTKHVAAILLIPAFVLWTAAYIPGNRIKAALGHPMILGVKLWAFAHLISNGRLGDLVLFTAFLVWAVLDYRAARRRDRAAATTYPVGRISRDVVSVVAGLAIWWIFARYLHASLIGVRPFG